MNPPKIVEHSDPSEVDGAYAYYDSLKNEIHILKPEALYQRILEHEMNHARKPRIVRLFLSVTESVTLRATIGSILLMLLFTMIAVGFLGALQFGIAYLSVFLAGFLFTLPMMLIARLATDNLEEFFAERAAIAKARKPKRGENPIP